MSRTSIAVVVALLRQCRGVAPRPAVLVWLSSPQRASLSEGSTRGCPEPSSGHVAGVDPDFFDESLTGRNVHWDGVTDATGAPVLEFEGVFRIN